MSDITTEEIEELRQLVKQADAKGEQSADWNGERLKACIIAGRRFEELKTKLGWGKWGRWIEMNDIGVNRLTAHRWMKIAKAHAKGELETATGVRKAYQLAGIFPDSDGSKASTQEPQEFYMLHATRLDASLSRLDVAALSDDMLQGLLVKLDKIGGHRRRIAQLRGGVEV